MKLCLVVAFVVSAALLRTWPVVAFHTERVSTKARALDVSVFRNWSLSVKELQIMTTQQHQQPAPLSREEAFAKLTANLNEQGQEFADIVQFVALVNDQVVGAVDAQTRPDKNVVLKNLRVDERHRRQGMASALVKAVIAHARQEEGAQRVVLNVSASSGPVSLYERHGFVSCELAKGGDDMRMVLELRCSDEQDTHRDA